MFKFFENLVNPYPSQAPTQPPNNVWKFCLHYCYGMKRYMVVLALSAGAFAAMEIVLFGFVAQLVDWLAVQNKETFLSDQAVTLWTMSGLLLIGMPIIILINNFMRHQTLIPNLTQRVRWMAHGYLLRQSMEFYQDDFAGRIAAKVMQGALAVRQIVSKLCDTFFYVLVGVISMLLLLTFADWRMAMPLVAWIVAFSLALYYFLPRLQNVSEDQANKRAVMTGRVVDSYTNIATVKLFAHTQSEASYAKSSMDLFLRNVFQMMRLSTGMDLTITLINNMLIFSTAALNIYLWLNGDVSLGMVAVSLALAMRLQSFSDWLMW
ncbi:MAG: ABC transporter transmembrane domain-containing protein, partial [Oceanospirillaceae bacterium]|nr:ABC transporter transmembrane domain-containing protein [Oceanospirillaceae bacterium]